MSDSVEQAKKDFYDGHEPEAAEALRKALESEKGSVVPVDEPEDEDVEADDDAQVPTGTLNTNVVYERP